MLKLLRVIFWHLSCTLASCLICHHCGLIWEWCNSSFIYGQDPKLIEIWFYSWFLFPVLLFFFHNGSRLCSASYSNASLPTTFFLWFYYFSLIRCLIHRQQSVFIADSMWTFSQGVVGCLITKSTPSTLQLLSGFVCHIFHHPTHTRDAG